jgi:hypothetical protein
MRIGVTSYVETEILKKRGIAIYSATVVLLYYYDQMFTN